MGPPETRGPQSSLPLTLCRLGTCAEGSRLSRRPRRRRPACRGHGSEGGAPGRSRRRPQALAPLGLGSVGGWRQDVTRTRRDRKEETGAGPCSSLSKSARPGYWRLRRTEALSQRPQVGTGRDGCGGSSGPQSVVGPPWTDRASSHGRSPSLLSGPTPHAGGAGLRETRSGPGSSGHRIWQPGSPKRDS